MRQTHTRSVKSMKIPPPGAPSTAFLPACRNRGAWANVRTGKMLSKHHQLHQPQSKLLLVTSAQTWGALAATM